MELPLQRSSMGFPGIMLVVWPKRVKRPLSNTWVSRDWPFTATSFTFGYLSFTRFPPGLMRLSPMSFLFLSCWQEPESEQRRRKEENTQNYLLVCKISVEGETVQVQAKDALISLVLAPNSSHLGPESFNGKVIQATTTGSQRLSGCRAQINHL